MRKKYHSWKFLGLFFTLACFFNSLNNAFGAAPNEAVKVTLVAASNVVEPRKPFNVYVVLDLEKGWHTYSDHPGDAGFPPRVTWTLPADWSASPLEFSVSQKFSEPGGLTINGYEHRAVFRTKITPVANLNSASFWPLSAKISWLACSDTLCVPGSETVSINIGKSITETAEQRLLLKSIADPSLWQPAATEASSKKSTNLMVLLLALGSGLLGGLILNLMPCVLPVISLKIFGFISQAGESRQKILRHGLAFAGGIYSWFLALGILVIFLKRSGMHVTWAFQFQSPAFLLAISILIFLFALNLFGVFDITLPGRAGSSLDQLASQNGYLGSFFQGLFATLLATPCTAPFLGSALGFAFAQPGSVIMMMFAAIATGMAAPYLLLSAQPGWMRCLPKPGAWMEHIKQLMGFPLLATNLWLLSVLGLQRGMSAIVMTITLLLLIGLSAWIYGSFYSSKKSWLAIALSLFLGLSALTYFVPKILSVNNETTTTKLSENEIAWMPYSSASLEQLRNEGRAIFVDFTAAWCLTCQFNERTAINTAAVRALLRKENIVALKADWTNANPEITKALQAFGRVGVPYYVFYPAGKNSKPITLSELLTEAQLINAFSNSH